MELWVRTQNKEILAKVDNLSIDKHDYSIYTQAQTYQIIFGIYKSKERALEVLDEIQEYINNNCEFIEQKTHTKMGTYTNKIDTNVYQMPEE